MFDKNAVRPGDPGYVYDVKCDFVEAEHASNDWDDSDADS